MAQEIEEVDDSESNNSGPSKTEEDKAPNAGCSEIKEVDDDSESNKAGPSKAPDDVPESLPRMIERFEKLKGQSDLDSDPKQEEEKAPNVGCSEIEEVDEDSESNKTGPSKAPDDVPESSWRMIENYQKLTGQSDLDSEEDDFESCHPKKKLKFDPKSLFDRDFEVKSLRSQVNELSSLVDILKFKIDDLKSGHRSRSRYLVYWHKITQLGSRISQLTRAIGFRSRIHAAIRRYRHRQQDGRSSPSLERVLKDEDERPEEQEAPKSGRSEKESETAHQRYLRKGKAPVSDSSTSEQHQEEDCVGPPKSIDEIFADQLMLSKEVGILLAEVNGLVYQALDLSKTTICYEQTPTFPNIVAELNRLRITSTVEPQSLFQRNVDLADKINLLLRTQVMALESLVANPKSPSRTHAGGWISGYFRKRGRSSPTLGRIREAESSSSDAALERLRGKEILKGCGFSFPWKKK